MIFYNFYIIKIIEKIKNDGELRDEMILVCNSIRKDLLHSNEWVRGRTLRLVSRIMYRGVLEPLASAIIENLGKYYKIIIGNIYFLKY